LSHYDFFFCTQSASIFFITYTIFEIPSNVFLKSVGARLWIFRIALTWGTVSTLMSTVSGFKSLLLARLLLGMFEAGFFPGVLLYLTFWYSKSERGSRMAIFYMAQVFAGIVGGLVAAPVLSMKPAAGLEGWRWLFIVEGIPALLLGIVVFFYLPDNPLSASWLRPAEREFLTQRAQNAVTYTSVAPVTASISTAAELWPHPDEFAHEHPVQVQHIDVKSLSEAHTAVTAPVCDETAIESSNVVAPAVVETSEANQSFLERTWASLIRPFPSASVLRLTFSSHLMWAFAIGNFCTMVPISAVTFFMPALIGQFGWSPVASNLASTIPYTAASIAMYINSRSSDQSGDRYVHSTLVTLGSALSFLMLAVVPNILWLQLLLLTCAAGSMWASKPVLFAWMSEVMPGDLAVAIAFVIAVGNLGGLCGPLLMGWSKTSYGSYNRALWALALLELCFAASLTWVRNELTRQRDQSQSEQAE
jgi:MFS family permease